MDHAKKLEFVRRMTKMGLEHVQHFDSGGTVNAQGTALGGLAGPVGAIAGTVTPGLNFGPGGGWSGGSGGILDGVSDFLGTKDNFQAGSADIKAGTNADQLNSAYTGTQGALGNQDNLVSTLVPQVGQAANNQAVLAEQLRAQSMGQGPNPALDQLNQTTAQNVANQTALMASQRGASANPALIARQAAQQGASTQQQAAGQAATMKAQQQLAAQESLANLSNNQIAQTGQAITGQNQAQQGEQGILQNANTAANNAAVNMQSNVNNNNAQTAIANQQQNNSLLGGIMKGAGALGSLFAEGGEVDTGSLDPQEPPAPLHAGTHDSGSGLDLSKIAAMAPMLMANGGHILPTQSWVGQWLQGPSASISLGDPAGASAMPFKGADFSPLDDLKKKKKSDEIKGSAGELPGAGSVTADSPPPGTQELQANNLEMGTGIWAAKGGLMKTGGNVKPKAPDEKAVKAGNSYANDKIPAVLSEGEIVLPRSVTMHKNAPEMAKKFVAKALAKKGLRK